MAAVVSRRKKFSQLIVVFILTIALFGIDTETMEGEAGDAGGSSPLTKSQGKDKH